MTATTRKAMAYVTRDDELLVFEHRDFPEVGLQVPAGSVKEEETPGEAVLREVLEETGLSQVRIVRFLGRYSYHMVPYRDEIQDRYVYQLKLDVPAPSTWLHYETHDGEGLPTAFYFFWLKIDNSPIDLFFAGQGEFLWKLREIQQPP